MQIFSSSFFDRCLTASNIWRVAATGLLLFTALAVSGQALGSRERAMILKVMADQELAWNKGDLEGFMQGYWHDDSLRFIGKSGITYGWQATLDNYKKSYPDRAAMGQLSFTILRVESLGKRRAYVTGAWHLQREKDAPQGYYTLLWRKLHGTWVIVADHSS